VEGAGDRVDDLPVQRELENFAAGCLDFKAGFGSLRLFRVGIDIEVDELVVGDARDQTKRQRFAGKNYREEHRKWYLGDSISAGIGQGYNSFTPIQLAHAIAMIANDGVGFTPHLVKSVQNLRTGEVREIAAEPSSRLDVKPEHLAVIKHALAGVNKEGTSAAAFKDAKYASAGKTGTAQVFSLKGEKYTEHKVDERLRDHAWFMAYAPVDQPRIAIAVLVENGGFGAQAAAPIARKVMDHWLLGKSDPGPVQIQPDRPSEDESD
jgi:penicillin-binding protein 2